VSKVNLVKAEKNISDAKLVMEWRNDVETLKMSFNASKKIWPSFLEEYYSEYFCETCTPPHFGTLNDQKVAFLRSRPYQSECFSHSCFDISINIDPKMRGMGLSPKFIEAYSDKIFSFGADVIVAEIKIINIASSKSFARAGYKHFDTIAKTISFDTYKVNRFIKRKIE
jgi:RimJ/RimL family protein N-acetyltransferase